MARALLTAALLLGALASPAQQVADTAFQPPIPRPAYAPGQGPAVTIDEGHHNFHTAEGRYQPFAALLRRDGYAVAGLKGPLTAEALRAVGVLVIANPLHARNEEDWSLPTPSAYTPEEVAAVKAWVAAGGALFLIVDHMPFPGGAGELAQAFGVTFSNGFAQDGRWQPGRQDAFDAATGLKESPATKGRAGDPPITRVATFTGSAFQVPKEALPVLVFGPGAFSLTPAKAWTFTPETPKPSIEGWCQGALLPFGKGRVAVFGEAAMFTAQLAGPERRKVGMNGPEAGQNAQLLLNVLHWLSRAPGMPER